MERIEYEQMTATGALQHGADAAAELRNALEAAGFCFPSLAGGIPVNNRGYVELGGISADEALRLASSVRGLTR